uniref:Somatic embryogenesis receptor kinase 1 n=1 Tax=Sedum alfredii TaxID=439688 RepID=A0A410N658_9MAGN|nr:somatic embryogenesis receptor kinase 1 [Sedum alfredii]
MARCGLFLIFWIAALQVFFFHSSDSSSFPANEVSALTAFKEAIYEDPLQIMSNWNALDSDPCGWNGIGCSFARDHVVKINISRAALKGFLAPDIGYLSFLRQLILHGNSLIGTMPKEIGRLRNLEILDLGYNRLTGPIPTSLGNLTAITTINLQSNGFTGSLPAELGNLVNLVELRLDRNKFKGAVPAGSNSNSTITTLGMIAAGATGFCRLSHLKVADFSYNFFTGSIPKCLSNIPRSSFQGNCLQEKNVTQRSASRCGASVPTKTSPGLNSRHRPTAANGSRNTSKPAWLLALEIVTGTMVGALILVAAVTAIVKFKSQPLLKIPWKKSASLKEQTNVFIDTQLLKDVARFTRQELEVACEDFSNIIGSSPDSVVYKGNIKGGPEIAVISLCIKEQNWTGYLELYFQREVADLARINHENTGKLLGYCEEDAPFTRMLVFEYASNGTLYEHLHYGEGCQFSWIRRMKIAIGIARGLKYLHSELDPPFTISELNSNAVYLTEDFSPKLVDFESWKTILARSEKNTSSIASQGAICVLPNSLEGRHLDIRGNVFAFGILLLELISGRPPYCKDKGELLDWAKDYLDLPEAMSYIVDPDLKQYKHEDLLIVCEVASLCIHPDPSKRPSMQEVFSMLESRIDTSISAELKASSLAWAELALSSS